MSRRSRSLGLYLLRNGLQVPSLIKSIQRGTITIPGGSTTNGATITAVVTANSALYWLGNSLNTAGQVDSAQFMARLALTNATTVTATRGGTTEDVTVSFEVVEYWPGVLRSVQRGTVAVGTPATITSVTTAKSLLTYLGCVGATTTGGEWGAQEPKLVLTNATTVTASATSGTDVCGYQVVEFY